MSDVLPRTILDRYILREVGTTWAAVVAVLWFILISNRFARFLGEAAAGTLPRDAVLELLALTSVYYLIVLVPVGLFLAVLLTTGRLYRDSELVAMLGCGVGVGRIFRPVFALAGAIAILMLFLSMVAGPWAAARSDEVRARAEQDAQYGNLEAGRFRISGGGSSVFYSEGQSEGGRVLERVFVQRRDGQQVQIIHAPRGEQRVDEVTGERWLVLYDGVRYDGVPGSREFRQARFAEHGIPIRPEAPTAGANRRSAIPTLDLLGSDQPADVAELQWRISGPLAALVLTLLSVPLSKSAPRQGRYGRLLVAILAYVIYSNLLGASQVWLQRGLIPSWLGLWWVHLATALLALALLAWQYGVRWRFEAAPPRAEAAA